MQEEVIALVVKLQDIVRRQTKGNYPDVNTVVRSLQDYVQDGTASKHGLENKLKDVEDILSKKNEKKKLCTDHIEKIRQAMRGKTTPKGTKSTEEKRNPSSPATSERATPLPSQTKQNKTLRNQSSPATSERATPLPSQTKQNKTISPATSERATPLPSQTKQKKTFWFELTQTDETTELAGTIDHNEEEDISRLKTENQYLRKTLDGLHKYIIGGDETALNELKTPKHMKDNQSIVEVEANVKEVTQKFHDTKTDMSASKQKMANKIKEYEQNYEKLRAEHQKLKTAYTILEKRCNDTNALSEHAGALLTYENPSIADLSDPNRPTKLAERYLELYDCWWTDAFSNLSKKDPIISENNIIGYLYEMLVDGYRFCEDVRRKQILALEDILFDPLGDTKTSERRQKEEMSQRFAKHLSDIANFSSNVTSKNMAKAFVMDEKTKDKYRDMIKLCETYIVECVQLCWLMQVQTPPLCLDVKTIHGQSFDKSCYNEYRKRGKEIAFVVWPALFLHENGPLLSKGVAQGQ